MNNSNHKVSIINYSSNAIIEVGCEFTDPSGININLIK